jgi:serine/threonine protein phosphatase PrpC
MGCDGIWEKRSNEEAVEYVYEQLNKQKEKLGMDAADKNIDKINIKEIVENLLNDNLATDIASS